jgi:thymidylate synthase ThyX
MKILLAGYNLDTEVIEDLKKNSPKREDITPETLSASYARISRDPRPIDELRAAARGEVEKARKSNRSIIFGMGHHSVAEHAVFNFDIIGVSRLAIEEIERFRLCSFTEKSQRYIKLENDFVLPEEIKGTSFEEPFVDVINAQNELYHRLFEKIKGFVFKKHSKLAELLFRRFASHEFAEVRELGSKMFALVEKIAPSIILFTKANDYDKKTYKALEETASSILRFERDKAKKIKGQKYDVKLEAFTPHPDDVTASALLHSSTKLPFADCSRTANRMKQKDKTAIIKTSMKHMELYDRAPREFEYVNLTYNLAVSSACFGQLKRHRLASIVSQKYDPELGVTIPQSVREVKMDKEFMSTVDRTNEVFGKISKKMPSVAQYVLTNSHKKRVLIGTNARELYHISRLREDMSAQWDIRNVAGKMTKLAKEVMPLTMMLVGGKDKYPTIYKKVYGRSPKVIQAELPK